MTTRQVFLIVLFCVHVYFSHGFTNDDDDVCYSRKHRDCDFDKNYKRLVCFEDIKNEWKAKAKDADVLIVCEWQRAVFNPQEVLRGFTSLRELAIAKSANLIRMPTAFPTEMEHLENITVTDTKLRTIRKDAFSNLPCLKCLDLRNNDVEEIDVTAVNENVLERLYLSGNPLRCTEDTAWILNSSEGSVASKVVDKDKLLCAAPFDRRPLVPVVEIIATLKEECKRTVCDCELIYVINAGELTDKQLIFNSINCSRRGLTEMPNFLPANTTTLRLTGNQIKDLTPLTTNPVYKSVLDLYLDDNLIESIVQLEGSYWLDNFRLLNLRGNRLTDLPTYTLENALLYNKGVAGLFLGNNSWTCDCHFTPSFQDLLNRHLDLIKDAKDIRCAVSANDNNSKRQIRDLRRTEICIPSEDSWFHFLDVVNIILASLIFLLFGNFLYDYWIYKTTGRLPWIATKIC
ncbi:protein singed wings 2 isoform X2 [Pseudomyrmex gracilis]|uniref:protein singed wings 2 isoform X2 n=1 Tax=Pseudomyrmex gracilis TaxID=219809 RepID=UPI000994EDE0|nr:protein singed wings 2 isoform X2 [Pseudomyrmex gracilis]